MNPAPASKPIAIISLWITLIFGAALLGVFTNAVNAFVSEEYFRTIMRWEHVVQIKRAIIAQGAFEGVICGVFLSTLFIVVLAFVSKGRCSYYFGLRYIVGLLATAWLLWVIGGVMGIALISLSPEFYRSHFFGVPDALQDRICYAWVGGSIWGVQFGGAAATFLFMVLFRAQWRLRQEQY